MTTFQHVAVEAAEGPHVTLMAGVDLAGRYWSTTSGSAAKVTMVRARPRVAVLRSDESGNVCDWTLTAGTAVVLDLRRPTGALADPLAMGLVGIALARIGLANCDQLIGYLDDLGTVPGPWSFTSRVLLVVHGQQHLTWRAGRVVEASGPFARVDPLPKLRLQPGRRSLEQPARRLLADLSAHQADLVRASGRCAIGFSTSIGPVVVPGQWNPADGTVRVDPEVFGHLHADVPGPCSVTFDDSHIARPSAKVGVMLRGAATLVGNDVLSVRIGRVTSWEGFRASTTEFGSGVAQKRRGESVRPRS